MSEDPAVVAARSRVQALTAEYQHAKSLALQELHAAEQIWRAEHVSTIKHEWSGSWDVYSCAYCQGEIYGDETDPLYCLRKDLWSHVKES